MLAIAIQNVAPDWEYIGSCTANNKAAFDALAHISGTKPSWADVLAQKPIIEAERAAVKAEVDLKATERDTNALANLTMEQADNWIDNNVTTVATARTAMKRIVRLILART